MDLTGPQAVARRSSGPSGPGPGLGREFGVDQRVAGAYGMPGDEGGERFVLRTGASAAAWAGGRPAAPTAGGV